LTADADGNRFRGESFDYNDICGGDEGRVTWEYKFSAGIYRPSDIRRPAHDSQFVVSVNPQ